MEIVERFMEKKEHLYLEKWSRRLLDPVLPYAKGKKILNAGCGSGWSDKILIDSGAILVNSFDIDSASILSAKNKNIKGVTYEKKDFNYSDFGQEIYDLAISLEVIEHIKNYEFYLSNLNKALKKEGKLYLTTPNKKMSLGDNRYHLKEFEEEEMTNILENNGFEILKKKGLSSDKLSQLWARFAPSFLTSMIKKTFFYELIVKKIARFSFGVPSQDAETLIYWVKKN